MPTKAAKWAAKVEKAQKDLEAAADAANAVRAQNKRPDDLRIDAGSPPLATVDVQRGQVVAVINGRAMTVADALRLRDWITVTFDAIEPLEEPTGDSDPKPKK